MDGVVIQAEGQRLNNTQRCETLIIIGLLMMVPRDWRWCLIGIEQREWKRVSLGERFKFVIGIALRSSTEERLDALCRRCGSVDGMPDRGYLFGRA